MLVKHRNVPAFYVCPIALPSQARHIPFSFPLLLGHKIYQLRTTICVFFSIASSNIKWKIRQYKRVPDLIITLLLLVYACSFTCFVGFTDHNWIDMIMWEQQGRLKNSRIFLSKGNIKQAHYSNFYHFFGSLLEWKRWWFHLVQKHLAASCRSIIGNNQLHYLLTTGVNPVLILH